MEQQIRELEIQMKHRSGEALEALTRLTAG